MIVLFTQTFPLQNLIIAFPTESQDEKMKSRRTVESKFKIQEVH